MATRKVTKKPAKRSVKRPAKRSVKQRDDTFVEFAIEQLDRLGGVRARSMFGGHGLYSGEMFFAVIDEGRLYFKVSGATRPHYEERGMGPFTPAPTMVMKGYYEVPLDVLEDATELVRWAREACGVAKAKSAARVRTPPSPRPSPRGSRRG